jgi:DNA-binding response OmpR family regulator
MAGAGRHHSRSPTRRATQKQYLHVYMGHLRNKLERDPARPRFLLTEPGVGYRLKLE